VVVKDIGSTAFFYIYLAPLSLTIANVGPLCALPYTCVSDAFYVKL